MYMQNQLIDLVPKQLSTPYENKSSGFLDKKQPHQFKSILNESMDRSGSNIKSSGKTGSDRFKTPDAVKKEFIRSFREISSQNRGQEASGTYRNNTVDREEPADISNIKGQKDTVDNDTDAANALAQMMGISQHDLIKLLASLNIKPEDLADKTKVKDNTDKLAAVIGLNDDQKQVLGKIIAAVSELAQKNKSGGQADIPDKTDNRNISLEPGVNGTGDLPVKERQPEQQASVSNKNTATQDTQVRFDSKMAVEIEGEFKELLVKLKDKLELLNRKQQQNPDTFDSQLTDELKNLMDDIPFKMQTGPKLAEEPAEEGGSLNTDIIKSDEVKKAADKKTDITEDGAGSDSSQNEKETAAKPGNNSGKGEIPVANRDMQAENQTVANIQKHEPIEAAAKAFKETHIPKAEIIKQVIDKAKVVISGEKSEMLMELKPDNLGKLAMRVVTERGMVVARFVAESQQVKEVLETNMQLLKDTLEKQGFMVQEFSVSVGQDSNSQLNRYREFGGDGRSSGKDGRQTGMNLAGTAVFTDTDRKVNPYTWTESSINLTA